MPLTRPTTTPLPDEILDRWVHLLGAAELKVLLYIVRRTLGFDKHADAISLTQFRAGITTRDGRVLDHGCGVTNRSNLVRALRGLEEKGLIQATKGKSPGGSRTVTLYALRWATDDGPPVFGSPGPVPAPGGLGAGPAVVPQEDHPSLGAGPDLVPPQHYPGAVARPDMVLQQHYPGPGAAPTRNSMTRNSQQNSKTREERPPPRMSARRSRGAGSGAAPDAAETATTIWAAVCAELRAGMTEGNYMAWLANTRACAWDGQTLAVVVPSALHQRWLDTRLRPRIEAEVRRAGYAAIEVRFVAATETSTVLVEEGVHPVRC